MRILIVEDSADMVKIYKQVLAKMGHDVTTSLSLDEIKTFIPKVDLVISDFEMEIPFEKIEAACNLANVPLILASWWLAKAIIDAVDVRE